jgi:hypothetical protein
MQGDDTLPPDHILRESFPAIPFMPEGIGGLVFRTVLRKDDQTFEGLGWTQAEADRKAFAAFHKYSWEKRDVSP